QRRMQNSVTQASNVLDAFEFGRLDGSALPIVPGLLIDEEVRSGCTMTAAAAGLRNSGSGLILQFARWRRQCWLCLVAVSLPHHRAPVLQCDDSTLTVRGMLVDTRGFEPDTSHLAVLDAVKRRCPIGLLTTGPVTIEPSIR